jgi:hypothetical protein
MAALLKDLFVWHTHSYTNEGIRFADTKAAAVVAWCSGLIAVLFAAKAHRRFMDVSPTLTNIMWGETILGATSLLAFLLLAAAVLCAFLAIVPRLWSREGAAGHIPGYIYWEVVRPHPSPAAYKTEVLTQNQETLLGHVVEHIYVLAGIAKKKYYWVSRSLWVAAIGSLFAGVVSLFSP